MSTVQVERHYRLHHYFHHDFTFSKVQMVMKRHRLGLDCTKQLKEMSKACNLYYGLKYTLQTTTLPQIVSGNLIRSQHWILVDAVTGLPEKSRISLCPHLYTKGDIFRTTLLEKVLRCKSSHAYKTIRVQAPCNVTGSPTEFQLDTIKNNG
jgi:hypothetical protein